jgi:hypothetical protein
MGPGLLVDRWIRQHCPDLQEAQEQAIESEITNNLGALNPSTRANYPGTLYEASISMNAAWGSPDFVDRSQGSAGVSVRAAMICCS